jgi:hypothetical protein
MSVERILERRSAELGGRVAEAAEVAALAAGAATPLPPLLAGWMLRFPLCGTEFALAEEEDESGLGVEMKWMTPGEMVSEAVDAYPGILAVPAGFLPVGMCLIGSGDPYFLEGAGDDPPLVRIPHDSAAGGERLDLGRIERVSARLGDFLSKAAIG